MEPLDTDSEPCAPGLNQGSFTNIHRRSDRYVNVPVFTGDERCIAIKAGMKAGKTTALKRFLETTVNSKERVLLTTGRIQQALSLIGGLTHIDEDTGERVSSLIACDGEPFKVYFYRDKEEALSCDKPGLFICQWESLHCLLTQDNKYRSFDYLICDEIRSTLSQSCVSVTNKGFMRVNMHLFRDICQKSRCLFFDADLLIDDMVERFSLKKWGGVWDQEQIRVEVYTFQSMPRDLVITADEKLFVEELKSKIEEAKKFRLEGNGSSPVFVACRSKRGMSDLLTLVTGKAQPTFLDDGVAYFSSSSTSQQMAQWENIDRFLRDNAVDLMLTTSKVTVCADMQTRTTACFILANSGGGCYVRDLFQTIGRARNPATEKVMTLVTNNAIAVEGGTEPEFSDIRKSLLTDGKCRRDYLSLIQVETGFDVEDENGFNKLVLHQSPDWVLNLACDSELESQRNRSLFHVTLLRTAVYKGWCPYFTSGEEEENKDLRNPLKRAHKEAGEELDEAADSLLSELKILPKEELVALSTSKADGGIEKEKAITSTFLLQFPDFIPHLTLANKKFFQNNIGVFERARAFDLDKESMQAFDTRRLVKSAGNGIPEKAALIFPAVDKFVDLFMKTLQLDFESQVLNAPIEVKNEKRRDIDDYYLSPIDLAPMVKDVEYCCSLILRAQSKIRSMRPKKYSTKNTGLGVIRRIDEVLKLFGRKMEACKDRTNDTRLYRIVQDENFFMMSPHYKKDGYTAWARETSIKEVIRKAKVDCPELIKETKHHEVVEGVKRFPKEKKRKKEDSHAKRKVKETKERVDVAPYVPFPNLQYFVDKAVEDEENGLNMELLEILDSD